MKKKELKELPSITGSKYNEAHFDYVSMVVKGMEKTKAFKLAYPEKYAKAIDCDDRFKEANLRRAVNTMDKNPVVMKMYNAQDKMLYTDFIHKKHKLLDRMYKKGMSDDLDEKDQIAATKVFMTFVPNAQKVDKVEVEVTTKDDHRKMLLEKKRELYQVANDEVVDVEVVEDE